MRTYSQDEIDAIFRELGLATEADRQRFQFTPPEGEPSGPKERQVFVRTQANSVAQEERRNAKLA